MRISSEVLPQSLDATHTIYGLFGVESLLIDTSLTTLYQHLKNHSYDYKVPFDIAANTSIQPVLDECNNVSLFSPHKIIELRISSTATKVINGIKTLLAHQRKGVVLIMIFGELTWQQQKTKWFTELAQQSLLIEHATIEPRMMSSWITRTAQTMGIVLTSQVANAIAEANAYNLLSAYNELQKIELMYDELGDVNDEQLLKQLSNNSKYGIYNLVDSALMGNTALVCEIYHQGNFEYSHLVNVLYIQLNQLAAIYIEAKHNGLDKAIANQRVWKSKINIIKSALARNTLSKIQQLLVLLGRVERSIKGRDTLVVQHKALDILVSLST